MAIAVDQIWKTICQKAQQLKQTGKLTVGVTTILNVNECPMMGALMSPANVTGIPSTYALITGSLTHALAEIYYESDPATTAEHFLEIARERMRTDHYATEKKWKFYKNHQDRIDGDALKYFRVFLRWAKHAPIPYARERLYTHGFVEGIVDRIDPPVNNKYLITDYKTKSSVSQNPNDPLIRRYKMQVWGGYPWLLNKVFPDRYALENLLPPHILIFRKASFKVIAPARGEDWLRYVEDFNGQVTYAAKFFLELAQGKPPGTNKGKRCYSCLARTVCPEFGGY